MNPTRKQPLFIVTGASGVGKSSACEILFREELHYIVMESDLLWHDMYNTPEDDYRNYRELWLKVCANISQIGKPVVLCGCAVPKQFDICASRNLFDAIHYTAIVCDDSELKNRMKLGRGITDDAWIRSSLDFNRWLLQNAESQNITLLNTTTLSAEQAAKQLDEWIMGILS